MDFAFKKNDASVIFCFDENVTKVSDLNVWELSLHSVSFAASSQF